MWVTLHDYLAVIRWALQTAELYPRGPWHAQPSSWQSFCRPLVFQIPGNDSSGTHEGQIQQQTSSTHLVSTRLGRWKPWRQPQEGTCSGYTGPSSYKSSVTKQWQTWHRTTSWAPAMARKRKESSQKALSSSAFPGCHNCSSNLDTAHPRHHNASADTQQAEKCLPSHPKVTSDSFSRSPRLSQDLSRLKIQPVSNEARQTRQLHNSSKNIWSSNSTKGGKTVFYFR